MCKRINLIQINTKFGIYIYDRKDGTVEKISKELLQTLNNFINISELDKIGEARKYIAKNKLLGKDNKLNIDIDNNLSKVVLKETELQSGVVKLPLFLDMADGALYLTSSGVTKIVSKLPIDGLWFACDMTNAVIDLSEVDLKSIKFTDIDCGKLILNKSIEECDNFSMFLMGSGIKKVDWGNTYIDKEVDFNGFLYEAVIYQNFNFDFVNTEKIKTLSDAFSGAAGDKIVIDNKKFCTCMLDDMFRHAMIRHISITNCKFYPTEYGCYMSYMFQGAESQIIDMSGTEIYTGKYDNAFLLFADLSINKIIMPEIIGAGSLSALFRDSKIYVLDYNFKYDDIKDTKFSDIFYNTEIKVCINMMHTSEKALVAARDNGFYIPNQPITFYVNSSVSKEVAESLIEIEKGDKLKVSIVYMKGEVI